MGHPSRANVRECSHSFSGIELSQAGSQARDGASFDHLSSWQVADWPICRLLVGLRSSLRSSCSRPT